jgi:Ala-tRNA(Pro) deacylase
MNSNKITRNELFDLLDSLGINHKTTHHRAVFTVDEGEDIKKAIAGGHSKNLFLKDKDGAYFLICALGETQIKMNHVHKAVGCARLSFGSAEKLYELLGVRPGSVCLFALANDKQNNITLILDKNIFKHQLVNFHPLLNDATTTISIEDMVKFVKNWGGKAIIADFSTDIPVIEGTV